MDIPVIRTVILYKMTQGRKSKGRKRKTEESQAPAIQDEPQAHKVSEEPEVTEEQPKANQEMPPPTTQASSQPNKRKRKEGPKMANIESPDQVLDVFFQLMEENPVFGTMIINMIRNMHFRRNRSKRRPGRD